MPATRLREIMHAGIVACSRSATPDEIAQVVSNCSVDAVVIVGVPGERGPPREHALPCASSTLASSRPRFAFGRSPDTLPRLVSQLRPEAPKTTVEVEAVTSIEAVT